MRLGAVTAIFCAGKTLAQAGLEPAPQLTVHDALRHCTTGAVRPNATSTPCGTNQRSLLCLDESAADISMKAVELSDLNHFYPISASLDSC